MDLQAHLPDRSTVLEYWPLYVGAAVIVVGNVYYYGHLGNDWRPVGPPLLVALLLVALLEIGRSIDDRT